ncbi:MAG: hypothetical protein LBQ60_22125 [Bacteroidales bacterium]|nr:hypothetical protein [Bacteroidales bacterium]
MPELIPASPEAAAIAKYINYPVDYNSGLVKIEIPLYEIRVGELVLPITLSYHASGIKVNENSGWVGLGWTLSAEPSVSRSVKGKPDEKASGILQNSSMPSTWDKYLIWLAHETGGTEEEPDEFYYRLLDRSGKFYFQKTAGETSPHTVLTHTYDPVNIEFDYNTPMKIEMIDDRGVYYRFGTALNGAYNNFIERTFSGLDELAVTCWKATEIISPCSRDTIFFNYSESEEKYFSNTDVITVEDNIEGSRTEKIETLICNTATFPYITYITNFDPRMITNYVVGEYGQLQEFFCNIEDYYSRSTTVRGRKIKTISFRGGKITFTTNNNRLTSINIYDGEKSVKTIYFSQSTYDLTGEMNSYGLRRDKLDYITITDDATNISERYSFSYYSDFLPDHVMSKSYDHWGYYNGANGDNINAVPISIIRGKRCHNDVASRSFQIGEADKNPNPNTMYYGSLKSITYPTGGTTTFSYEPHRYFDEDLIDYAPAGGLRIVSIEDYDRMTDGITYRYFEYGPNSGNRGIIKKPVTTDDYMIEQTKMYLSYVGNDNGHLFDPIETRFRTFYSSSLTDLFYSGGSPVFYDMVTEYVSDDPIDKGNLGKTVYKYKNYRRYKPEREELTDIFYEYQADWMDDQLQEKIVYRYNDDWYNNSADNKFIPVSHTKYFYEIYKPGDIRVAKVFRRKKLIGQTLYPRTNDDYEDILYKSYAIKTGISKPIREITKEIYGSDTLIINKTYGYRSTSNTLYQNRTEINSSTGDNTIEEFGYTEDVRFSGDAEIARQQMLFNRQYNNLLLHTKRRWTKYKTTKLLYDIFDNKVLPATIVSSTENSAEEARIHYHEYDRHGNPVCVSQESGPQIVYIWGYNFRYPIAKIENTSLTEITGLLGEDIFNILGQKRSLSESDIMTLKNLRTQLPNAHVNVYTYHPLIGMSSETDPSGRTIYYEYSSGGMITVKDEEGNIIKEYFRHYSEL